MSHGVTMYAYNIDEEYFEEDRKKIRNLFLQTDIGTEEERKYVCNYFSDMLTEEHGTKGFAFWNYGKGQEVEEYDVLAELSLAYGKIASSVLGTQTFTSVDFFKDSDNYNQFCCYDWSISFRIEDVDKHGDLVNELKLKHKVSEGERAKKMLDVVDKIERSDTDED